MIVLVYVHDRAFGFVARDGALVVHHNPDLADGANSVVAIVSIKSNSPGASNIVAKKRVLGFVVDGSGSMDGAKWKGAKQAVIKGVEAMPTDGNTYFFVIMGGDAAHIIVETMLSTDDNKRKALAALAAMNNTGGTYFARWLAGARAQFAKVTGGIWVITTNPARLRLPISSAMVAGIDPAESSDPVKGVSAEFELAAPGLDERALPQDLLAVLGWDWARLIRQKDGWKTKLRLRGQPDRRTRTAEQALQRLAPVRDLELNAITHARFLEMLRAENPTATFPPGTTPSIQPLVPQ